MKAQNYTKCVMPANAGIQLRSVLAKAEYGGYRKFTDEVQHFLYKWLAIDVIEAAPLDGPEFSRVKRYR